MKTFKFLKNKYNVALLIDIGTYKDIPNYFFESELHHTDFYELIFFSKGNGYLELDHQRIEISDKTVVFISPFQKRRWFLDKTKVECYFLFFQDSFLSDFFSDKLFSFRLQFFYNKTKPLYLKVNDGFFLQLTDIIQELISEIKTFKSDSEHIIRALLYFILIKLNRAYAQHYQLSSETENNSIAYMFKEILQNKVCKVRNIDYYSQELGISRVTLNKCIKKQFGVTASEMINEFILFEIKSLLNYTKLNINEISDLLQFSHANHLTRFFKAQTGISPKEFRNTYQNGSSFT
ncbi:MULTISPECIES: helix-turn-helix domain-containing protein [Flavobacterium]|uniref:Helix-turn-helix domain-containing protein n=1 Tax=Flavobacterium gyeonganense TaxID=1310418 RepID=A0ABV5HC17_9FLAO|nr:MULTISPECIES: helix-turn-helix domain-containing protein [Flavobacterium]MBZ4043718.1 helix-turn-helix transcriptional regulator [Flavobacterium hibisci]